MRDCHHGRQARKCEECSLMEQVVEACHGEALAEASAAAHCAHLRGVSGALTDAGMAVGGEETYAGAVRALAAERDTWKESYEAENGSAVRLSRWAMGDLKEPWPLSSNQKNAYDAMQKIAAERDRLRAALEAAASRMGCDAVSLLDGEKFARRALYPSAKDPNRNKTALPVTNEGGSETSVSCGEIAATARRIEGKLSHFSCCEECGAAREALRAARRGLEIFGGRHQSGCSGGCEGGRCHCGLNALFLCIDKVLDTPTERSAIGGERGEG